MNAWVSSKLVGMNICVSAKLSLNNASCNTLVGFNKHPRPAPSHTHSHTLLINSTHNCGIKSKFIFIQYDVDDLLDFSGNLFMHCCLTYIIFHVILYVCVKRPISSLSQIQL